MPPEEMTPAELLARVPLFHDLTMTDLEQLASVTQEVWYEDGEDIVEIGDPGHSLFIVLEGGVQVLFPGRSKDFELARLGPGDFFGEMSVLNNKPRSATVRSVGGARVLALDKEDFSGILLATPAVALQLLGALSVRLRNTDEQVSGLNEKAIRDSLTGLLNRRAFHERIVEECGRTRRYGDDFSLILLDVDDFKSVNDTFGHDTGDTVLAWLGRLLDEHTRTADTPFRLGGEEFAILCPRTSSGVAETVANRLVGLVSDARPPLAFEMRITVSGGFSSCPIDGSAPEALFQVADKALLAAKSEGRNRVCAPDRSAVAGAREA